MLDLLRKLKPLVTGERQDLATGEVVDIQRHEKVDPVPMAPPVGYRREPSLMEKIQMMVLKDKVDRLQAELGADTPEEAEDFDVEDAEYPSDPVSPHEFERHEYELLEAMEKLENKRKAWEAKYGPQEPQASGGAAGGTPPAGGASAPVPAPAKGAPAGASPPPSDELDKSRSTLP